MVLNFEYRFCAVLAFLLTGYALAEKHVICYYGTWATYRNGLGKFDVGHINTDLCTHAVYTFTGLDDQGNVISLDPYLDLPDDNGRDNFRAFNALKQKNPMLKTILAVGGWNEGSAKFSVMAANPEYRQNFISTSVKMLKDYGFDGLDVDWEYPNQRDTVHNETDVENFTLLLKEIREEFDKHGFLLSAAVASVKNMASISYDIPVISRYLDLINIMTYDMHGAWDLVTGHNAPLHRGEGDDEADKDDPYTVDKALQYWLDQGAPQEKLVFGVPSYGRTFNLTDADNAGVRAPSSGPGLAGPYTASNGYIGYNEFCLKLKKESWIKKYDALAQVPYAHMDQNWVSYDNADSISLKVEYAMSFNISGIMLWSIETDDFRGLCGDGDFPLLRAVNKALGNDVPLPTVPIPTSSAVPSTTSSEIPSPTSSSEILFPSSSVTSSSEISSSEESSSSAVVSGITSPGSTHGSSSTIIYTVKESSFCTEEGFAANPADCNTFFMCVITKRGSYQPWLFQCPNNLHWDQVHSMCNYPELAQCNI